MSSKSTEISTEQILKEFPALSKFKDNANILKAMYASMNKKHDMSGLTEGINVDNAEVLVASVYGIGDYNGCPDCFSKLSGEVGSMVACTNARRSCSGQNKIITKLYRYRFLGGDNANTVLLDFLPFGFKLKDRTEAEGLVGKVIRVSGYVNGVSETRKYGKLFVVVVKNMKVLDNVKETDNGALEAFHQPDTEVKSETKATTPGVAPISPEIANKLRLFFHAVGGAVSEDKLKEYLPKVSLTMDALMATGLVSKNADGKYIIKAD
jgi:hypothetical protein